MSGLPSFSFIRATTSACCWRSNRTRQAPTEKVALLQALLSSTSSSIAASASTSNSGLYESVRSRAITGRNISFNGHSDSTTCHPESHCSLTESSGLPSAFTANALNRSKFFIGKPPVKGCGLGNPQSKAEQASHPTRGGAQ